MKGVNLVFVYTRGGGGELLQPLPWVFAVLRYKGNVLPLIDSLSCEVNIMDYGVAGGP